jgi:glycosyltransferase involved in cell wall biosynthesis
LHNRYRQAGGEDVVVRAERALLDAHGHAVELLEVDNDGLAGVGARVAAAAGALYSPRARARVERAIKRFGPDVVHVHNFFPRLSPAVYDAARTLGVPVVQTLHNYRLTCANGLLLRDGAPCQRCVGLAAPWPGVLHGCYRDSRAESAVVAGMVGLHRALGTWPRVDAYVALTGFQAGLLAKAGVPAARIHLKPNFCADPGWQPPAAPGEYALFVGRIAPEKGLETVIEAYVRHGLRVPLVVAGDGELRAGYERRTREAGLADTIRWVGAQTPAAVQALMARARFLVFPSIWYEPFGLAIIEAFACGLPVLGSDLGGVPELVQAGGSGWLVPPGDAAAWAGAIARTWELVAGSPAFGAAARRTYEARFTPAANLARLIEIYEQARTAGREGARAA